MEQKTSRKSIIRRITIEPVSRREEEKTARMNTGYGQNNIEKIQKRGRGRPRKIKNPVIIDELIIKRVGRPRKLTFECRKCEVVYRCKEEELVEDEFEIFFGSVTPATECSCIKDSGYCRDCFFEIKN